MEKVRKPRDAEAKVVKSGQEETLQLKFSELKVNFGLLTTSLTRISRKAKASGQLPPSDFVDLLTSIRKEFVQLQNDLLKEARRLKLSTPPEPEKLNSLTQLDYFFNSIQKERKKREKNQDVVAEAIAILKAVLELSHTEVDRFAPLLKCQDQAKSFLERMRSAKPNSEIEQVVEELVKDNHPFCSLLRLAQHGADMDDEEWEIRCNEIKQSFGNLLSVALVRNKLILSADSASKDPDTPQKKKGSPKESREESEKVVQTKEGEDKLPERSDHLKATSKAKQGEKVTESTGDTRSANKRGKSSSATKSEPPEIGGANAVDPPDKDKKGNDFGGKKIPGDSRKGQRQGLQIPFEFTSQQLAVEILKKDLTMAPDVLGDLAWRLILEDKLSLAYHVMRCLEDASLGVEHHPSSWIIRSSLLGRHMKYELGEISNILKQDFGLFGEDSFPRKRDYSQNYGIRFLLISAALRPALFAPRTGAVNILRGIRLKDPFDNLHKFLNIIAEFSDLSHPIEPTLLRTETSWQAAMDQLGSEARSWWNQALTLRTNYQPATRVWKYWLEKDQLMGKMFKVIIENESKEMRGFSQELQRLSDKKEIRKEINQAERQLSGRRRITEKRALGILYRRVKDVIEFGNRWLSLCRTRPSESSSWLAGKTQALREGIQEFNETTIAEIGEYAKQSNGVPEIAAGRTCIRAVRAMLQLFDPDVNVTENERLPEHLLNAELLKIPEISVKERLVVESGSPEKSREMVHQIIHYIAGGEIDWRNAFENQQTQRNHLATKGIIEFLETHPNDTNFIDRLREKRRKSVFECREALRRDIDETAKRIEEAVTYGLLKEKERNDKSAVIEDMRYSLSSTLRFNEKHARLALIRHDIKEKRSAEIKPARERLRGTKCSPEDRSYKKVDSALKKGDVLTANEYIDMIIAGEEIPRPSSRGKTFNNFFPETCSQIERFLEKKRLRSKDLAALVRNRQLKLPGLSMANVTGAQAGKALLMIEAWLILKREGRIENEAYVKRVLEGLGFNPLDITVSKRENQTWIDVSVVPIKDRTQCPVPVFGSAAKGHYRILCVWGRPSEEEMLNLVGETRRHAPAIVFHFGRLTEQIRRGLAQVCRHRTRTFLVIDDILILYLCGERSSHLRVMFECSLPFTVSEPYTTTAGLVPPEVFYGRQRERDSIVDPMGTCFIYGGRQLGKTAVLRDVERTSNSPDDQKYTVYLDLKAQGIGLSHSIDSIWQLLDSEFKKLNIIRESESSAHESHDKVLDSVERWLKDESGRRLLLLLDEADVFLKSDGHKNFIQISRLKGLMDKTERRFKVVFAGLHNVQRTTRQANNPLAHYGEPMCIGPLLDHGESKEARDLIERPTASLGYRFESVDLVTRILSQTNYYPSLIQLYCQKLIELVNNPNESHFDFRLSPPYVITSQHVDNAYQKKDLGAAVRERFMWTVHLDLRYELLAFCIAFRSGSADNINDDGLSVDQIRDEALSFWKAGFQNSASRHNFKVLLDEMVGLGVLRAIGNDRYGLRNPNIITLLGTQEEIDNRLVEFVEIEAPSDDEPSNFRGVYLTGKPLDLSRRNPLTMQQESELLKRENGVFIILGCEAANLKDLFLFLRQTFGDERTVDVDPSKGRPGLDSALSSIKQKETGIPTLVFISEACDWAREWVDDAVNYIDEIDSSDFHVRIVFVANPQTTWQLVDGANPAIDILKQRGVNLLSLERWHDLALRQWFGELQWGPRDHQGRKEITKVTGNWPILLDKFYGFSKSGARDWQDAKQKLLEFCDRNEFKQDMLKAFGFDFPERAEALRTLCAFGDPCTSEELMELNDVLSEEWILKTMRWADLLNLVSSSGADCWSVDDPLVKGVLCTTGA